MKVITPSAWMFSRKKRPAASVGGTGAHLAPASGLAELQAKLSQWSRIWVVDGEATPSEEQRVVAERLCGWIERCFGKNAHMSVAGQNAGLSMASSTPLFTAFLGRRATRELSRRLLEDI
jgi:hypothetical protein